MDIPKRNPNKILKYFLGVPMEVPKEILNTKEISMEMPEENFNGNCEGISKENSDRNLNGYAKGKSNGNFEKKNPKNVPMEREISNKIP